MRVLRVNSLLKPINLSSRVATRGAVEQDTEIFHERFLRFGGVVSVAMKFLWS